MPEYLSWCEKMKGLPLDLPGTKLESANEVKVIFNEGDLILLKFIRPEVCYVPRIKALGEVAYALFDWYLNEEKRVTPNVCALSPNIIWREFILGRLGETWRGDLYAEKKTLEAADLVIVDRIQRTWAAQRIALLDFIFLCQDRSANNWLEHQNEFWAIDNGIFWPHRGRFADRLAVETGEIDHLRPPMEVLVSHRFEFKNGIFSSLYAGESISPILLRWLNQFDWDQYLNVLTTLICEPLGYPQEFVTDWRFEQIKNRARWLCNSKHFPTTEEVYQDKWQSLIGKPKNGKEVWQKEWETENLETL